jgi:hypothetical protein
MAANFTDFVANAVLTAAQLNGVLDNFSDIAIFNETQANGTGGGASTTAFKKRTLNTTIVNNITGCSIASSVVTLATAGTYYFRGLTPSYTAGGAKSKIRNTTASTDTALGQNVSSGSGAAAVSVSSQVEGTITITATTNFELQSYEQSVVAGNGIGVTIGGSASEVYSTLFIQRIA